MEAQTLDEAVRIVKDRHKDRKNKRSRLSASSTQHSVREATALSTELQLMVAWGILRASAAAVLARKQKEDYELLGVAVPKEIGQMAAVGKSGEITSHVRRDFFRKFKPASWLPTPVPARVVTKGKRGEADMRFVKENLLDPFNKAEAALTQMATLAQQLASLQLLLQEEMNAGCTSQ